MVWQETGSVAVIVMLTRTLEQGQNKCFQYFPRKVEDSPWVIDGNEEYGDGFHASLTLLEKTKQVAVGSSVRKLSMVVNGKEKIVWHFLFKGWPDFGVPAAEQKTALLELIKLANIKNTEGPLNPLIVGFPGTLCIFPPPTKHLPPLGPLFCWCRSFRNFHHPRLPHP